MIKKAYGFTIVELLIVIVVIAILAVISVVSYMGIQNRASDTAVQSDLRNLAMKVREFQATEDRLPAGISGPIEGISKFLVTQQAYLSTTDYNFYYCRGIVGGNDKFGIIAASASGTIYAYTSDSGTVAAQSGTWAKTWASATVCPRLGIATTSTDYSYSYARQASGWLSWAR